MSVQTWMSEFYPKPVHQTAKEEAVQHSLTKWQGLTPENLAKHGVRIDDYGFVVQQGNRTGLETEVRINGSTCSLCLHYLNEDREDPESSCSTCPLYEARGNVACDAERDDEDEAPWYAFRGDTADPQPMIFWLTKTLEMQSK